MAPLVVTGRVAVAAGLALAVCACGDDGGTTADAATIVLDGGGGAPSDASDGDASDGAVRAPWIDGARVHMHTRLWRVLEDAPEFGFAAASLAELGAQSFSRHVKTGSEDPWWPSAVPVVDGGAVLAGTEDLVDPMARGAAGAGLPLVAFYWHGADERLETLHPEWICRAPDGTPRASGRGTHLDATGAYGDVVLARLLELVDHGARGAFLDGDHVPRAGCYGGALEAAWEAETGGPAPLPDDAAAHARFLVWSAARFAETLRGWRDAIAARDPTFALVADAEGLAGLYTPSATTALLEGAHAAKTEWNDAFDATYDGGAFTSGALAAPSIDARLGLGWSLLRDARGGRPPHVYAPGFPNADHARGFVAAVIAHGAVANLDVAESLLLEGGVAPADKTPRDALIEAAALGRSLASAIEGTAPVRWAAVHFAERARDERGGDAVRAWREVLGPIAGAYEVMQDAGVPIGVVADADLTDDGLAPYSVLVLGSAAELDAPAQAAVDRFEGRGGAVLVADAAVPWTDPMRRAEALTAFGALVEPLLATAPVRLAAGSPRARLVAHARDDGSIVVIVLNGIAWVQPHGAYRAIPPDEVRPAPPPLAGVQIVVRGEVVDVPPVGIVEVVDHQSTLPAP